MWLNIQTLESHWSSGEVELHKVPDGDSGVCELEAKKITPAKGPAIPKLIKNKKERRATRGYIVELL